MSAHAATVPDEDLADTLEHEQASWLTPTEVPARPRAPRVESVLTRRMRWVLVIAAALVMVSTASGVNAALSTDHDTMTTCVAAGGVYSKTSAEVRCDGR